MNEQAIHREHKLKDGHILQIFQDTWAESPRSWDNLGTMGIFHNRYNFGDEVNFAADDFGNWSDMQEHIENELKAVICIPIYMYDHGGITINTTGFACPWDSGQIGFIYLTKDKFEENGIDLDKAKTVLQNEVKTMNDYLIGDVYGFNLLKKDNLIDSCSGFYGEDLSKNGMLEYIPKELIPEDLIF